MSVQFFGIDLLKFSGSLFLGGVFKAVGTPACFVHFENKGAQTGFVLIGVSTDDTVGRILEKIVKSIQGST